MAESRDLLFRFLGDAKDLANASRKAKTSLKDVDDGSKKTAGGLKGMATSARLAVAGAVGLVATGVVSFLKDAATAAMEDQAAQKQLALALENSVGATDSQISATEEWIDATARATGVADDDLRPALAELVRTTGDLEQAQETMGVAMDIAAAKGVPLETVTKAIGKAALGNIGALGRLGVATKDAEGDTLTFEEALAEAARTMGGATAVAADTAEGKMRRLQVAFDEGKESVGTFVVDGIGRMLIGAQDIAAHFGPESKAQKAIQLFEIHTGSAVDTAAAALTVMKDYGQTFEDLAPHINLSTDELLKLRDADDDFLRALGFTTEEIDTLRDQLETGLVTAARTARDKGIHPLKKATDEATESLEEMQDEIRSQMDPMFALVDATNDLEDAQQDTARARDEYGENSPQHRDALFQEAKKWLDLKDAQVKAASESGITKEKFRANLEAMKIFTRGEIDQMMTEFDKLDGRTVDTTIRVNLKGRGADTFSDSIKQIGKQAGGPVHAGQSYVVGERGPEVLTMGNTGGHVIAHHRTSGVGPQGSTVNITVNGFVGSEAKLAGEIDRVLTLRGRRSTLGFLRPGNNP